MDMRLLNIVDRLQSQMSAYISQVFECDQPNCEGLLVVFEDLLLYYYSFSVYTAAKPLLYFCIALFSTLQVYVV